MSAELQILHLEDSEADGQFIHLALMEHGLRVAMQRVWTPETFIAGLEEGGMDLIISDFSLPGFDGLAALELAREKRPEVPFIFVSGTLGEEVAIDALKSGASDYVFKHRLLRLGSAVERAVADADRRRELQRVEQAMVQSEHKYRQLFDCLGEAALLTDAKSGRVLDTNRQAENLLLRPRAKILGTKIEQLLSPKTLEQYRQRLVDSGKNEGRVVFEGEIFVQEGLATPVSISATPIVLHDRRLILGLFRDVSREHAAEAEIRELRQRVKEGVGGNGEHLRAESRVR